MVDRQGPIWLRHVLLASVGCLVLTACGGGDGGLQQVVERPPAAPEPEPEPEPGDDPGRQQHGLAQINAAAAYERGFSGAGILVAVVDDGFDIDHPRFAGRVELLPGQGSLAPEAGRHGTRVAGIIAAALPPGSSYDRVVGQAVGDEPLTHGVAWGASILPVPELGALVEIDGVQVAEWDVLPLIRDSGARIVNNSWRPGVGVSPDGALLVSSADVSRVGAYLEMIERGMVIVSAAGNGHLDMEGHPDHPSMLGLYPHIGPDSRDGGLYALDEQDLVFAFGEVPEIDFTGLVDPEASGAYIAVVAVDQDGEIWERSNRCGVAADWCIAAPGVAILSTEPDGGFGSGTGTSGATPHVSGAVAVLMEAFDGQLTARQIVDRLFATANRDGPLGDREIYGQGLLDLGAASAPIGPQQLALGDAVQGPALPAEISRIRLGPAFGDGLAAALAGETVTVFDELGAPFAQPLAGFATIAGTGPDAMSRMVGFGRDTGLQRVQVGPNTDLRVGFRGATGRLNGVRPGQSGQSGDVTGFSLRQDLGAVAVTFSQGDPIAFGFAGLADVSLRQELRRYGLAGDGGNPLFGFADDGAAFGVDTRLRAGLSLRTAAFEGRHRDDERIAAWGTAAELVLDTAAAGWAMGVTLAVQGGLITERGTLLGSRGDGAFALDGGTPTLFWGLSGALPLDDLAKATGLEALSLIGAAQWNRSNPRGGSGLIGDVGTVTSDSFRLGLHGGGMLRPGDRFGVTLSQPLRVSAGQVRFDLPDRRTPDGAVTRRALTADLVPTGREIAAEAFYALPMDLDTLGLRRMGVEGAEIAGAMQLRSQPGHRRAAPLEGLVLLRATMRF